MWPLVDRLYRLLLCLYPARFRQTYGDELLWVFHAWSRDTYHQSGLLWFLWLWLCSILDLAASGFKERFARKDWVDLFSGGQMMQTASYVGNPGFGRRLAQVLDQQPAYGATLVAGEPTRPMLEVVDSVLLDGDPDQPETALALFQEMGDAPAPAPPSGWQALLREAARRNFLASHTAASATVSERLLHLVYADPNLYELLAAADTGESLYTIVDLLALDCDMEEMESTLRLLRQLADVS
jgi:hypothetical protein